MKKYRYGDPTKVGFFRKYGHFLYFFAAWNLLGLVAWKSMGASKQADDENWNKMSSSDKYLSLIGMGRAVSPKEVKHVKITGLSVETSSESEQSS